jgi:hypothetical protein
MLSGGVPAAATPDPFDYSVTSLVGFAHILPSPLRIVSPAEEGD